MDEKSYQYLARLKLQNVSLIKLTAIEDKKLKKVKEDRTIGEYCWTCTPAVLLYVFRQNPKVKLLSYLDADLYFFSTPEPIFQEMGRKSVMIIPHRFASDRKAKEKVAGIFNVSMLTFRRDKNGLACLRWWRDRCIEWCYNRQEDGKVGDQKYLESFSKLFKGVHSLKNIGAGLAPWNIRQYKITKKNGQVFINSYPLIFYHFLGLKLYLPNQFLLPSPLNNYGEVTKQRFLIYEEYFQQMYRQLKKVQSLNNDFNLGFSRRPSLITILKEEVQSRILRRKYDIS